MKSLNAGDEIVMSLNMDLMQARSLIEQTREHMNALYGDVVFDEWALVTLGSTGAKLAAYDGPRIEKFRSRFVADSRPLQAELDGQKLAVGEFAFVADAAGTAYDACVRVGGRAYLWCNHTSSTMAQIRESKTWLKAQRAFVQMTERFQLDPLEVE